MEGEMVKKKLLNLERTLQDIKSTLAADQQLIKMMLAGCLALQVVIFFALIFGDSVTRFFGLGLQ